jgi:hypothetical protein
MVVASDDAGSWPPGGKMGADPNAAWGARPQAQGDRREKFNL